MPGHSFGTEAAASLQMCAGRPFTVTGVVLVAGLFGFGPIDGVKLHIYSVSFFTFCCFDFSRGLYCFTASCQVCTFSCFQLCLQLYIVFSVPFSLGGQFLLHLFLLRCLCRTVDCFTSLRFLVVVILQRAAVVHHTTMHFQLGSHRIGLDHGRAAPKRPSAPLAGQAVCEEP